MANYLNYARLEHIAKTDKPYRGTTNNFPIRNRRHSYKRFLVEQDEKGETVFKIVYGDRWGEEEVTKEYYDAQANNWSGRVVTEHNGDKRYIQYTRDHNIVGIIRKDNTFELTADYMHQGTRGFLTSMMGLYLSYIASSVRHGGTVYKEITGTWRNHTVTKIIPLFKGQCINLDTMTSVVDYEVRLPAVNRTRSKDVMAKYDDALKFNETMFKTMSSEVFEMSLREVYEEVFGKTGYKWRNAERTRTMLDYASAQVNVDMYKAICATMIGEGIYSAWTISCDDTQYAIRDYDSYKYFKSAKDKIASRVKIGGGAFDVKVYKANEPYPSNRWGVSINLNNERVIAY